MSMNPWFLERMAAEHQGRLRCTAEACRQSRAPGGPPLLQRLGWALVGVGLRLAIRPLQPSGDATGCC